MDDTNTTTKGYTATPEELAAWKKKYGENNVFRLEVDDLACYVRKPNRRDLAMIDELGQNGIADQELLLGEIWLAGDEAIKTDDEYFLATIRPLRNIVAVKAAELKKA